MILSLVVLFGCDDDNHIFPNANVKYIGKYHCWPYNVKMYSVNEIKVDSLFFTYPLHEFSDVYVKCRSDKKCHLLKWTAFNKLESQISYSFEWDLKNNNEDTMPENLLKQIKADTEMYFTGGYRYFKSEKNAKEKRFYKIALYIPKEKQLHIFEELED